MLDFSVIRVNSAEAPSTAERETSSVNNGCSDDDGWGIETVRKLWCEPYGRPGATLAGVEASGMPVSQPFTIGTWTIRFFCAPADDDVVLGVGATIRGGGCRRILWLLAALESSKHYLPWIWEITCVTNLGEFKFPS